jgi:tetratricopeptide (TPR) repeat protein
MLGDVAQAEEQSHIAEQLGKDLGNRWLEIEGRVLRAQAYNYSGQPNRVPALIRDDFEYLSTELRHETSGQTMIRAVVAGAHIAMAASAMGNFAEATPFEDEATAIASEAGRPFDLMYMHYTSGMRLDFQGRASAAVEAHRRSVAIAEEHDLWFMTTFAQPWLGHALLMDDRADEALELLRRIEASAHRVELPFVEALSQAFAAQATQRLGDADATRAYAAAALDFDSQYPNPVIELAARTALGLLDKGSAEGLSELHKAADLAGRYGFRPWLVSLQHVLGDGGR